MRNLQQSNIESIMNQNTETSVIENHKNIKIVTFIKEIRGEKKPMMMVWRGKQKNPFSNYYYQSLEKREESMNTLKVRADEMAEYKEKKKEEKKAFTPDFEVGDIFYTSWGYEQTNVEFYQVIEKPTKHYAIIQEIAGNTETLGHDYGRRTEIKDSFLDKEPIRRKVGQHGIRISSVRTAWKSDGSSKHCSWGY